MAISPFNIDGMVPPFVGARGPGGSSADMSPYVASALRSLFLSGAPTCGNLFYVDGSRIGRQFVR